ncbi:MAG: RNA polymerase sigma factor [Planctomycetota bacterium]
MEKEIIKNALKGDKDALAALITKYQDWISRWAFKIVKNSEDAADITQEVCLKIVTSLSTLQDESKFLPWVYRITYHISLNWLRIFKKIPTSTDPEMISEMATRHNSPEDRLLEKEEDITRLDEALQQLPYAYRVMITMYYFDERSYEEISRILKIPIGTVKTQLFRAKKMLSEKLTSLMGV